MGRATKQETNMKITHKITNTSDKYLLVGDAHAMLGAYDTKIEAKRDMDAKFQFVEDSGYASLDVLEPGESLTIDLVNERPLTASEKAEKQLRDEASPVFARFLKS
jgi:hypothetical protein